MGRVRSQVAITTRNLDHASHAQNRFVLRPAMTGPAPQSHCGHIPGSGIHGRYTRRRPAAKLFFASATARRTVRSEPSNPNAFNLAWQRSAGILPQERSTHSSIFGSHRFDDPFPPHRAHTPQPTLVALSHIRGDGVMRTTGQLAGIPERPSQVERFQHVHDFLARLHLLLLLDGHGCRDRPFE